MDFLITTDNELTASDCPYKVCEYNCPVLSEGCMVKKA